MLILVAIIASCAQFSKRNAQRRELAEEIFNTPDLVRMYKESN